MVYLTYNLYDQKNQPIKMNAMQTIRVSIGSATVLGLKSTVMETPPTTCYLMTNSKDKCLGNCAFCPQRRDSDPNEKEMLSRIQWPEFSWQLFQDKLINLINSNTIGKFHRICLQTLNYPHFFQDVKRIIGEIHQLVPNIPISAAIPPISENKMTLLKNIGLDTVCFALDACTPELFKQIKGKEINSPYKWDKHLHYLDSALHIFGRNRVTTHLIVGLGETEEEMILQLQNIIQKGILPGIFFFTPIKGTPMAHISRKPIIQFRHIQIARYLLLKNLENYRRFKFNAKGNLIGIVNLTQTELNALIELGEAFKTAGCSGCNRPFYTSRPGEEQDGYPRDLTKEEQERIKQELIPLIDEQRDTE